MKKLLNIIFLLAACMIATSALADEDKVSADPAETLTQIVKVAEPIADCTMIYYAKKGFFERAVPFSGEYKVADSEKFTPQTLGEMVERFIAKGRLADRMSVSCHLKSPMAGFIDADGDQKTIKSISISIGVMPIKGN